MTNSFDEAHARYLSALKKLDQADEIAEKNLLFRQLTQQLSDLEQGLSSEFQPPAVEDGEAPPPWDPAASDKTACRLPPKTP